MPYMNYVEVNPNDNCGGGGCACHEIGTEDTKGPFVVFPLNEMENPLSPHVVVCAGCIQKAAEELESGENILRGGEVNVIDGTVEDDDGSAD